MEWILKQRPSGLLPALEELAKHLMEQLKTSPAPIANHVCGEGDGEMAHPSQQILLLMRMLTKIVWWVWLMSPWRAWLIYMCVCGGRGICACSFVYCLHNKAVFCLHGHF